MKHFLLTIFAVVLTSSLSAQITDGSFEATGAGGNAWTSTSTSFGTSLCDVASCGTCGGPCVPRTGSWYVWFGGTGNAETGTAVQNFNVTSASAGTLYFHLKVPMKGAAGDTLAILLDGVSKRKIATIDSIGAYTVTTVDMGMISAGAHTLTFRFQKGAGANVVNVLVDDVSLSMAGSVGIEEIDFSNGIQISSNLDTKVIKIAYNLKENQNVGVNVTDITGKVVYKNGLTNQMTGEQHISAEGWAPGVYHVTLTSDTGLSKTTKIAVH